MDIVSHALIGAAIGEFSAGKPRRIALAAAFAAAPDFAQALLLYPYVGWLHGRAFLLPIHSDWDGFRGAHPVASMAWEVPHSLLFVALVVYPFCRWRKLPWTCSAAYVSHIFVDVFTHTGEWAVAPLWPLPARLEGIADPWRWTPLEWAASIAACATLWLGVRWARRRGS